MVEHILYTGFYFILRNKTKRECFPFLGTLPKLSNYHIFRVRGKKVII